jgi:hypothetical protein
MAFFFALCLEDLENQILFAKAAGAWDLQGASDACQFSDVFFLLVLQWSCSPAKSEDVSGSIRKGEVFRERTGGISRLAAGLRRIGRLSRNQVEHRTPACAAALNGKPPETAA